MIDFKGHRFEKDVILLCVRWYLAYPLSYRNLEEMLEERGVRVDHPNVYRKTICFSRFIQMPDIVIGLFINCSEFGINI